MLLLKNVAENLVHRCLWRSFVEHLAVALLVAQIINLVVYGFYTLLVELTLARKYGVAACREQNIVVERGYEQPFPRVKERWAQVYA